MTRQALKHSLLLVGLLLLAWDWNRPRVVINLPAVLETTSALYQSRLWEVVGAVPFAYTAGYRAFVDTYDFLLWFGGGTIPPGLELR